LRLLARKLATAPRRDHVSKQPRRAASPICNHAVAI